MQKTVDIYKAAGIIIRDRRLLVTRSRGKDTFIAPGGKLESDETPEQALVRELNEELQIKTNTTDFVFFGRFYAPAAGQEHRFLQMDVYVVAQWAGTPTPSSEIEEMAWITSDIPADMQLGSIFEHEVVPRLKAQHVID